MNKPIIEVRNLSKKYTLGERQPYYSFRDTISGVLHKPFKKGKLEKDEFWALKDISFDVNEGDVIGVIGRNGAGKSTLLKILSQITPPTEGEVVLRGRVASLLEVGTGFHPELTGRENIYLNGAILGMKRWEINNRFKEIVDFAETEKFLDTPIKHYSSGMYMRLAFSVAAHLEPEILLVDEVLAVGDVQFQKKCLGKMSEVSKQGRTVIFVSHNLSAISNLCDKSILIDKGKIIKHSDTSTVLDIYNQLEKNKTLPQISKRKDRKGDGKVIISKINITNIKGENRIRSFDKLKITINFNKTIQKYKSINVVMGFYDLNERGLFRIDTGKLLVKDITCPGEIIITTGVINLTPCNINVNIALYVDGRLSDHIVNAANIIIEEYPYKFIKYFDNNLSTILTETKIINYHGDNCP